MKPAPSSLPALAPLLTLLFAPPAQAQDAPAPRPRSVLFYLIDTCRADRTRFDGYERDTTPFLAELAERSVVFEACTSQAPWTKPSMASMLTSQYPSTTGLYRMDQRLADEFTTWPEVLQAGGLYTAGFSANIVMGNSLSNLAQGFDHFVESTQINHADPIRFASGSARKLNGQVLPWLASTDHWPMLLYVHSVDPHEEYEPEPRYLERFADPKRHERYREDWKKLLASRPPIPGLHVTQASFDATGVDAGTFIEHGSNLYDADILANDDQLGRLWEALQEDGWGQDLILVLTSDHGEEFFEHGATSHGYSLYEEMTRVPLLIHAPGLLPEGKRIRTPVRSLDIYPTLCELLGLEVPQGLEGRSLLPLIRGEGGWEERPIFSEYREDPVLRMLEQAPGSMVSLRSGSWKLVLNLEPSQLQQKPRLELFDLAQDPREQVNLAQTRPEVTRRMEAEIEAFLARRREREAAASAALDPAALEQLRALGYVGEDPEPASGADLWAAFESQDLQRIRGVLEAGADPDQLEEKSGVSPLSIAALVGSVELTELLLEHGAHIDVRNRDGSMPLASAAFLGRVDVLNLLLEKGADPAARDTAGGTALDATAVPWEITEFIAKLLEIPVDRKEIEAGRKACAERLRAAE